MHAAGRVEQPDAHRRLLEEAPEALLRALQGVLHVALAAQVAHHRARGQAAIVVAGDDLLGDVGVDHRAIGPGQHHLAVPGVSPGATGVGVGLGAGERRIRRRPGLGGARRQVVQPQSLGGQALRRGVEPLRQGGVGEHEAALLIDRIEAHRRVLQQVDEAGLLALHDLLHLAPGGDVLGQPHHQAGGGLDRLRAHVEPHRLGVARGAVVLRRRHRQLGVAAGAVARVGGQPVQVVQAAAVAAARLQDRRQRRRIGRIGLREVGEKGRVGALRAAVAAHHLARPGN